MMIQAVIKVDAKNKSPFYGKLIATFFITFFFFTFTTFAQAKTYALGDIKDTSPITIDPPKYVKPTDNVVVIGNVTIISGGGTTTTTTFKSSSKLLTNDGFESQSVITLPSEKDWSDVVTPIKNQDACGSCVIFATTAALESFLLRKNKKTFDISEQYGLSCHMPANLCGSGTMLSAYFSPLQIIGTSEELSQYPYTASFGSCSSAGKFLTAYNFAFKVNSYEKVGIRTADELKATLVKYGPVVGAMKVHNSFYNYSSGIYKPDQVEQNLGGHAILIVGYSDKIGGFKVKNSWGTLWGDKGFFWIAYDQVGGQSDFGTRGGGVFAITDASAPDVAPQYLISSHNVSPSSAKAGSSFTFTANLNMTLPSGWKVKIDLGSGTLSQMTNYVGGSTTNYSLSRNLSNIGTYTYKIGVYDSKDVLQGVVSSGTYKVESAVSVITGYTKIANDGSVLPDSAILGSNPKDWACTKDNKTGLIWEVKTDDGGLRDKDWYYSWYEPGKNNGGNAGYTDIGSIIRNNKPIPINCSTKSNCNTYAFKNTVNQQSLCGATDWRMPSKDELIQLVFCSDGKYGKDENGFLCNDFNLELIINKTYFPNTQSNWYWSSVSDVNSNNGKAWFVGFGRGDFGILNLTSKDTGNYVRLVRNSSNSPIINPTPIPVVPTVTNVAPTLKLISNSPDAVISPVANYKVGVPYNVTVKADDIDGNLKSIDIDWGDGVKESSAQSNGGVQISFKHTYTTAGNYTWKVIAYDLKGASSNSVSKWLKIENPSIIPVVTGFVAPKLITPENNVNLPLKKSQKFTWEKVNQATKYQIIFAVDSNFSSYDKVKNKCLNAKTCFTYTVSSTSYALNANHAMVKTEGVKYYWQVQSLNKTQRSASSEIRNFTAGTPKPAVPPEIVKVSGGIYQYQNVLGNKMSFTATLNTSFPQYLYSVKISIDDSDFQTMMMNGVATEFIYNFNPTEIGDHHFTIAIFDKDGVVIDTLGDNFFVVSGH
jgi:C1A family cysteine protease